MEQVALVTYEYIINLCERMENDTTTNCLITRLTKNVVIICIFSLRYINNGDGLSSLIEVSLTLLKHTSANSIGIPTPRLSLYILTKRKTLIGSADLIVRSPCSFAVASF